MTQAVSTFQKLRAKYQPRVPTALRRDPIGLKFYEVSMANASVQTQQEIRQQFRHSIQTHRMLAVKFTDPGDADRSVSRVARPLRVGVVLSGGQAPGGHNVVAGLWDALQTAHPESRLFGFLGGPAGVVKGKFSELTQDIIDQYRNTGGFHMIGTGRDKIEKPDELEGARRTIESLKLDGLVIIGGDDSNTNAAILAEYLVAKGVTTSVIGVPKTIDGDLRSQWIDMSFGFDTATRTYAELVGNICLDCISSAKYWYFIRLMGRSASHITLEVALQTRPNLAIISEEVRSKGLTLADVAQEVVDLVRRRAEQGKTYGVVLIPEGLLEFLPDMRRLIDELNAILRTDEQHLLSMHDHGERVKHLSGKLSPESAKVYASLPQNIQEQLLRRDSHGNIPLSQIDTDRLLIDMASAQLRELAAKGQFKAKFQPLNAFFGYEGRSVAPNNFDADYTWSLGHAALLLVQAGLTGYTVSATGLAGPVEGWVMGGVPITAMMNIEVRKGEPKPVISKALVDLNGGPFQEFARRREDWKLNDEYISPGPIQYFGPPELCDSRCLTLVLEKAQAHSCKLSPAASR